MRRGSIWTEQFYLDAEGSWAWAAVPKHSEAWAGSQPGKVPGGPL